ncbi:glycoside hydrolase family 3 protein [Microbacterium bovistercoris]|uniref:Glycoside hydrolase family 3 protein n=1 Tax=Microbacterium bovistercoris TaxID=2293570 RepID=A0A371NRP1_9MICO|nr:glycoside hydrolase family 3 N-terminal domain-containing protein [Microbacterium bovistercoris]REJ04349.1 glycoside hydrolase family 3 protein [Microbacterium bovistercoris]
MDDLTRLANGVVWPGFLGGDVPRWLEDELRSGLAGVVYFAQNLHGDTAALSARIHAIAPHALIGIDEEGGSVTRLETGTGSTVPSAAQLGMLDDVDATQDTAAEIARRCAAVGVDVVLAPVADVNTDPRNPVIGTRAFGSDTAVVSRHVAAAVRGIQGAGIAACAKHYPGHGDTHTDSHHDLPRVDATAEEMAQTHLPPFSAAVQAGVRAIMTAHIAVPAWGETPATLNPAVLGMLRDEGFDGVIVTDALDMAAIRETVGIGGGAVRALAAGADLLCVGNPTNPGPAMLPDQDERDFRAARDAIVAALRSGELSRERVEEAAARVARMAEDLASSRGDRQGGALNAESIVRRAIAVQGELPAYADLPTDVIDVRRPSSLAVDSAAGHVASTLAAGGRVVRLDAETADDAAVADIAVGASRQRSILLVDRLDESSAQRAVASAIAGAAPDTAIVNVGVPGDGIPGAAVLDLAAASLIAAQVARRMLTGN